MRYKGREKAAKVVEFVAKWLNLCLSTVFSFLPTVHLQIESHVIFFVFTGALDWFLIVLMATVALGVQQVSVLGQIWATPTTFSMVRKFFEALCLRKIRDKSLNIKYI